MCVCVPLISAASAVGVPSHSHCLCFSLDCLIVSSSVAAVAAALGWSSAAANYRLPFSAGGVLVAD